MCGGTIHGHYVKVVPKRSTAPHAGTDAGFKGSMHPECNQDPGSF